VGRAARLTLVQARALGLQAAGVRIVPPPPVQPLPMSEAALLREVQALGRRRNWLVYHGASINRGTGGYPDLTMVHPTGKLLMVELKSESGVVSNAQHAWLNALAAAGVRVAVWTPADLASGTIERALTVE
jgi:hypothetical protein